MAGFCYSTAEDQGEEQYVGVLMSLMFMFLERVPLISADALGIAGVPRVKSRQEPVDNGTKESRRRLIRKVTYEYQSRNGESTPHFTSYIPRRADCTTSELHRYILGVAGRGAS